MEAVNRRADWQNLGGVFAVVVCTGAITAVWRSLDPLFLAWSQPEYSHAWFIPPLAVLIFIHRFNSARLGGATAPGVLAAILSITIMLLAWATGSYTASIYGAILGIIGFVWSSVGSRGMKTLAAPLVYLFSMVPLPVAIYISTSAEMQLLSSKLGMVAISLFNVPASLDGNIIILPSARLEVAEACNGLRYLFPLVSFAFLVSMVVEDCFWKKALVVLSSFPIAIIMNAGRIAMIAVMLDRFNIDTSTGAAHAFEGFAVFLLCIVVLFLEVWCLIGIGKTRGRFVVSDLLMFDPGTLQRLMSWPMSRTSLLAGTMLLVGASAVGSLPARTEIIPNHQPFALFPMDFDGWRGTPQTLDADTLNALRLSDYLLAEFTGNDLSAEAPLSLYVAYYASQRAGIHAHSPRLCIPGGGWSIISQSLIDMPWATGSIAANRVIIEKGGVRQIVYYWFEERGRHIADEGELKYYALKDALFANRSDGALIRVVAPINDGDEAAADSMARKFVGQAGALLQYFVSGRVS
ncbi:VPLPA-CTERM-specific exosortase XrtD [Bradyrhizobium sp. 76]|uniref:VPLPA-CTERM-specific exosortase XrtD n=1 Tax=Bradyrhizobium sp. 76 TaxID=2782680 RepID=UPI001FF779A1|nr:VPLPA-CTERM-specific exosortase XrtD [Bradyrhizobium sp. 76]